MGENTLTTRSDGQIISSSDVNQYKTAFNEDIVPRSSSGVATDEAGDLGTASLKWDNSYVNTYNIGTPANGLKIEENGSNQMSFLTSGTERVVIDDNGLDAAGLKNSTVVIGKMASNSVGTSQIVDANVTTAKIADSNVTTAKIADSNVTTAKINDKAVTARKRSIDILSTSSSGTFSTSSATYVNVFSLAITLPTIRPLRFDVVPDDAFGSQSYVLFPSTCFLALYRNTTLVYEYDCSMGYKYMLSYITGLESAASNTYYLKVKTDGVGTAYFYHMKLVATYI